MSATRGRMITLLLAAFLVLLRLPYIGSTPFEYESWRQSDTEAIARNFAEHRFHILYPQLNYNGPLPNYAQLELQVTTFLIAVLYKLFGEHYALARMVPISFFLGSCLFLYNIAKKAFSRQTAWIAMLLYGLLPINLLYSRAIMPEAAALFFYTGAYFFYQQWTLRKRPVHLFLSALWLGLAIAEKIPAALIGVPIFALAFAQYRFALFARKAFWAYAMLALLPVTIYYIWLGHIAESPFVNGLAGKHIVPNMLTAVLQPEALRFFAKELPTAFSIPALAAGLAGLLLLKLRKHLGFAVWLFAVLAELAAIVAVIRFPYYLIFLGPILSLLAAYAFSRIPSALPRAAIVAVSLLLLSIHSWQTVKPMLHTQKVEVIKQAEIVRTHIPPEALIITGVDDPTLLNASRRQGWRVNNAFIGDLRREVDFYIEQGAEYFVPLAGYIDFDDGSLNAYLASRFTKLEPEPGYPFYRLK